MVVDASAIAAILFDEPEADLFNRAAADAPEVVLSTANYERIAPG